VTTTTTKPQILTSKASVLNGSFFWLDIIDLFLQDRGD
jgi:hypothetical protein